MLLKALRILIDSVANGRGFQNIFFQYKQISKSVSYFLSNYSTNISNFKTGETVLEECLTQLQIIVDSTEF